MCKKMKRIVFLAATLILGLPMTGQNIFRADAPEVTYVGRVQYTEAEVRADWSGAMAIVRFEGKSLSLTFADSGKDWVNVWVDKEPEAEADAVLALTGEGSLPLASFKKKGVHTVYIQKRTEGECGCITFRSFTTDGVLLPARPVKDRVMEIIGDSYTCGYGVEAPDRDAPAIFETENCNKSYSGILGRFFDADVIRVSHSGRGIVRNYDDGDPGHTMPVRYRCTFDCAEGPSYEPSYTPDIVLIYLGTNDFSTGKQPGIKVWCDAYRTLLQEIRANYGPAVPILCVASNANPLLPLYVQEAVEKSGVDNVHWTAIYPQGHNITSDLGGAWHPNYPGMRKVAGLMAPYVATLTGWEYPFKAIE